MKIKCYKRAHLNRKKALESQAAAENQIDDSSALPKSQDSHMVCNVITHSLASTAFEPKKYGFFFGCRGESALLLL